ncbi:predicted protein [Histoplasma mississippiense (nom. inval.)]|uniref:predicted protein n=1 Tax=Ajellomyces capsulatus (strain NAm1 / WU24) TaxID=2059318 RepID=UPI000157C78D|nr:predicted protein [Histoplasma mississippiense (nom. inval.)]EDN08178.1 predicted protein [Histoplasma mississippiense (nom. inval.)]
MAPLSCLAGPDKQSRSKTDVKSDLDTLSALDAIFSDSGYESGSVSEGEDDDEGQLPPEHYLALAESLDVSQLRQKRYSPKTQEKLDEICDYWERGDSLLPETASGLGKDTIVKVEDIVARVATEKMLVFVEWSKKNMYIEDIAEFAQSVLITTEMTFTEQTLTEFKIVLKKMMKASVNVILQHMDIRTFVKHYQVDVDMDAQGIVRKTGSQTALVRFACSMKESRSLNSLPVVLGRQATVRKRKRDLEDREAELERANKVCKTAFGHLDDRVLAESNPEVLEKLEIFCDRVAEAKSEHNRSICELRNEKQQQRNRRICENLERYKNEQPVIDLERQLAGKLVDTKVMDTFEHEAFMPPEHLLFVDSMLTMPGACLEAEYQQRINTINAGVAFCGMEEGRPSRRSTQSRSRPVPDDDNPSPPAKRQRRSEDDTEFLLRQAIESVQVKSTANQSQACFRPRVCFLCVGNPSCSLKDRIMKYATPGSLTRHFQRRHINPPWPATGVECNLFGVTLRRN